MSLIFNCPTCGRNFDASIQGGATSVASKFGQSVIYMDGNLRVELNSEDEDCKTCAEAIEASLNEAKQTAREKLRAQNNDTQTDS